MTKPENKTDPKSNSGFMFGLTLGAAVGALSAILINKSNETEVVQNFESKVKEFFQDLVSEAKISAKGGSASGGKKIEFIDVKEEKENPEKSHVVIHRKSTPKMFVKHKK